MTTCPCGIDARDCEYHREQAAQPSLCQYCDAPRVMVGFMFNNLRAPVSLCAAHYREYGSDFPLVRSDQ